MKCTLAAFYDNESDFCHVGLDFILQNLEKLMQLFPFAKKNSTRNRAPLQLDSVPQNNLQQQVTQNEPLHNGTHQVGAFTVSTQPADPPATPVPSSATPVESQQDNMLGIDSGYDSGDQQ